MADERWMLENESVVRVERCDLRTAAERWPYEADNATAIDAAWAERLRRAPHFWNGTVLLLRQSTARVSTGVLSGEMWVSDFKSFAHWNVAGRPDADAFDCFGSTILRSAEGHVVLGRQGKGLSAGQCYLPSGVIDGTDVDSGTVNIDRHVAREMAEETGLDAGLVPRRPGYLLTRAGNLLSIGVVFDTGMPSAELRADILAHIAREPDPELADVIAIASPADFAGLNVQRYSVLAIEHLLAERV